MFEFLAGLIAWLTTIITVCLCLVSVIRLVSIKIESDSFKNEFVVCNNYLKQITDSIFICIVVMLKILLTYCNEILILKWYLTGSPHLLNVLSTKGNTAESNH